MNPKNISRVTYLSIAFALLSNCFASPTESRSWTSNKGTSIKAQALYIGDQVVLLKTEAGKEVSVPISSLSQADRDFLQSLKKPAPPEKEQKEETTPQPDDTTQEDTTQEDPKEDSADTTSTLNSLPILTEGEGKGLHAFYKGDKYTASIDRSGTMIVYYLDEKKNIKPDWRISISPKSFLRINHEIKKFPTTKITKHGEPQLNPKEVKLTFLKETGIVTEITLQFTPKGFTTWFHAKTTSETPTDTEHMVHHHFGPTDPYPKEDLISEKMSLKMTNLSNQTEKYDFNEIEILRGNMAEFEIRGPIIGKGKIIIERPKNREAVLVLNPLPELELKKGFSVYNFKEDHTSKDHKAEKLVFTFK